ncbi:hypothetical protein [uncultured Helicobacter sp.]|uniref:hypothetical protein n=1 Tax=uncultured Helicobacter sp. TaxID=175537 RepID=UPI001C39E245|nr:hypothetical protein [Candidatus Helicobacter avicola]
MKTKYILIGCIVALYAGCVSVDIKTEIPEVSFYDISLHTQKVLKNPKQSYGTIISAAMPYDSTDIYKLDSQTLRTRILPNAQWVSKPKEMLVATLGGMMSERGLSLIKPPFGSVKVGKILKLHIDKILIIQKEGGEYATLSVHYDLLNAKDASLLKNGIIVRQKEIANMQDFAPVFLELSQEVLSEVIGQIL